MMQNIYLKTSLYVGVLFLVLWGLVYYFLSFSLEVNYIIAINITTYMVYSFDKGEAEENSSYRVPEKILHVLEAMGGSVFAIIAQHILHHKSSKESFFIKQAIKKFQKENGLQVDGIIGNKTYKKLMKLKR